jgi:hexosaminidase
MSTLPLVPLPLEVETFPDSFLLTSNTAIISREPDQANSEYLQQRLSTATGYPFPIERGEHPGPAIILDLQQDRTELGDEGYILEAARDSVKLSAPTNLGLFRAIQTLLQLLPPEIESRSPISDIDWVIPGVKISDQPRFSWRGFMLDEGRHFHGKETVMLLLDIMASLKMNIFHWHLTEDQGWRIEIQGYPRLTEIGSQRPGTSRNLLDMILDRHDDVPHGGHYTHEDIREIVAYAAARHITIVPEIEMPGHSMAALTAYPQFSCTGGPFEVATRFGIFKDVYCPGKEATFTFLQDVLDEVMALFPGPYIHIGGDEAPKMQWKKCPDCQQRIAQEGLRDEHDLQTYFTNRIAYYLADHGRTMIGWNEALSPDLHPKAMIQYWFGNRKGIVDAIRNGRKIINSAYLEYYLDHSYSLTPLSRIYNYEPAFSELSARAVEYLMGVEAPLWTEFVPNRARLDYQTFPRLLAVAETSWTANDRKDFADFSTRLVEFQKRLDVLGIRYAREGDVDPPWFKKLFGLLTIAQPQRKIA